MTATLGGQVAPKITTDTVQAALDALGLDASATTALVFTPGRVHRQHLTPEGHLAVATHRVEGWEDDPRQARVDSIDLARAYLRDRYPGQDVSRVVAALVNLEAHR